MVEKFVKGLIIGVGTISGVATVLCAIEWIRLDRSIKQDEKTLDVIREIRIQLQDKILKKQEEKIKELNIEIEKLKKEEKED